MPAPTAIVLDRGGPSVPRGSCARGIAQSGDGLRTRGRSCWHVGFLHQRLRMEGEDRALMRSWGEVLHREGTQSRIWMCQVCSRAGSFKSERSIIGSSCLSTTLVSSSPSRLSLYLPTPFAWAAVRRQRQLPETPIPARPRQAEIFFFVFLVATWGLQ
ncbi:hypothetical protein GQ53DRAFT_755473 [Thozetella sp. PMI_491]|nr:hypothetical protein GQ53DRAFT_755473 [Thozetella sp. PMI_491]